MGQVLDAIRAVVGDSHVMCTAAAPEPHKAKAPDTLETKGIRVLAQIGATGVES